MNTGQMTALGKTFPLSEGFKKQLTFETNFALGYSMFLCVLLYPNLLSIIAALLTLWGVWWYERRQKIKAYIETLEFPESNKVLLSREEIRDYVVRRPGIYPFEVVLCSDLGMTINEPWYTNDQDTLRRIVLLVRHNRR